MEDQDKNLGSDIDPETGNFVAKEHEKKTFMSFHPFEENWQDKPESREISDSIREEYEQSPTEIKFLAGVCDGTVLGAYERLWTESKGGEQFYTLTNLDDDIKVGVEQPDKTHDQSQIFDIDRHFNGYHSRGNISLAMKRIQELKSKLDIGSEAVKSLTAEGLRELVNNDEFFSYDDIAGVSRFATTLVIFIEEKSWKKYDQDTDVPDDMTHGAFYSKNSSIIYAPITIEQQGDPIETLKHEYSHLIDYNLKKYRISEEGKFQEETLDYTIKNLKSEISAFLSMQEKINPYELLAEIQARLKEGYVSLYGDEKEAMKCDRFFELIGSSEPFISSLINEAGLDSSDPKIKNMFLRTFLTTLPERPIVFRMLEKMPETGLYQAGTKTQSY